MLDRDNNSYRIVSLLSHVIRYKPRILLKHKTPKEVRYDKPRKWYAVILTYFTSKSFKTWKSTWAMVSVIISIANLFKNE